MAKTLSTAVSASSTGAIIVGAESARLRLAEETALNLLLKKYGGEFEGQPWFKISWAPNDNKLSKKHDVSCPKRDPHDIGCNCPTAPLDPLHTPLCFDEHQICYHLLAWREPTLGDELLQHETGDDLSKGLYECTGLHFVDEKGAPLNPTAVIIERIIPSLKLMAERAKAATYGADATVRQLRQRSIDAMKEREERKRQKYQQDAADMFKESDGAFGGVPFSTLSSPGKSKLEAEVTQREIAARSDAPVATPDMPGPILVRRAPRAHGRKLYNK